MPADSHEKWWQLRLRNIFISMALFGAFLATAKWASSTPDRVGLVFQVSAPLLLAAIATLIGQPLRGVIFALVWGMTYCLLALLYRIVSGAPPPI